MSPRFRGKGSFDREDSGRGRPRRDRFESSDRGDFGGRDRRDSGRSGRGRFERRGRPEMTKVICDKCGERCEVPFRPTAGKPIYCEACFRENGGSSSRGGSNSRELEEINKKLDKIIKALDLN